MTSTNETAYPQLCLGTAPDSWGVWMPDDPKQVPWNVFLDEAAAAGYVWIELGPYGYLPTNADQLHQERAERDLQLSGGAVFAGLQRGKGALTQALWGLPAGSPPAERPRCSAFGAIARNVQRLRRLRELVTDPEELAPALKRVRTSGLASLGNLHIADLNDPAMTQLGFIPRMSSNYSQSSELATTV
jgi:hypothetical protein